MSEGASHSRRTKPGYEKPAKESSSSLPPSVIHLISGGIAGCVAKSSIAPFDRVKILFQINHPKYAYTGVFSTLSNIAKTEGFSQLWRGNTATVARVFPYAAIQFMSYEKYKQWLLPEKQTVHPIIHLCCGSLAGATATTFTYPLDLVRARLASEIQTRTYRHIFHGLAEIYRKEGLKAWFRGMKPTLEGIIPYAGVNFGTYETLKYYAPKNEEGHVPTATRLLCGGLSGAIGQTVSYPWDVVRRRMQIHGFAPGTKSLDYNGSINTMRTIVRNEGWRALYRSTPPPGALKEGSTKPEPISPRRGKTPPEPVIQSALEQEKIQALKEIFIKMKSSPEQRTVSEEEFLRFISVPEILQPFAKKFFSAICKTQIIPAAPTNTKKKAAAHHRGNNNNTGDNNGLQANTSFDLVQFVRAIEICFRGTNIDQVTFLFSGYEEDFVMNRSQEGSLEVETKRRVKISDLRDMLQDSGVLSFYNKEYEDYLEAVAIMLAAQQQQAGTFQPHPDEMEPSLSSEEEDIPNKETKPSEDAEKKENTSENNDNKEGASNNNEEKIQNVENNENPNNEEDNNNNTNEPKKPSATIGHNVFAKMADAMISSVKSDQQKHGQGNSDEYISLEIFLDWVMENTPSLTKAVENFVQLKFLREVTKSNQTTSWIPMMLNMDKSKIYDHSLLWALTSALDGKKSSWKLLYSTTQHGQSLNRLAHHVSSYNGPSLILIRNTKREVFGAYVTHVWRTTSSFQGDAECFLFSFTPNFNVYRSTGVEKNYAYLFTTKNTFSNFPVGLGFGGTTKQFRLYVDDDLLKGESRASCTTYRPGTLSSDVLFEVLQIEVWGCGGNAADEAQATARKRNEKHLEKRRKVNRKMMADGGWENSADKFLMDLVGKTGHSDAYMEEIRKAKADKNKE